MFQSMLLLLLICGNFFFVFYHMYLGNSENMMFNFVAGMCAVTMFVQHLEHKEK